jgi:hypothetical protein
MRAAWQTFKTVRPSTEAELQLFIQKGHQFWNQLVHAIPELQKIEKLTEAQPLPKKFRSQKGGDFLFRAIAPPMIARCLRRAETFGMDEALFIKRFAKIPRSLSKAPWLGILWDGTNMIIAEKNQQAAEALILWMVNCDPNERKYSAADLKRRLGVLMNKPAIDCQLPAKLR